MDTDMGPDYDDVGALTLLHAFEDQGKAKILATIASTKYPGVGAVLSVFNTYFKKPEIPIGVPKKFALELKDWQHWTDSVRTNYPHSVKENSEVPDAVPLYRKILAKQPDHSVTIITIGFLTNLAHLLQSPPDGYANMSGRELVAKKVKKLVSMAGKYPSGKEFNIDRDISSAVYVFDHWETPIILSGFEIGEKIKCGLPIIHNNKIQKSPVKDVFRICIPMSKEDSAGRKSWDETAVMVAILGYSNYYTAQPGKIIINEKNGSNTWVNHKNSKMLYLVEKKPFTEVQNLIDELLMHQPGKLAAIK
ncbi:MAG: hypothetical protein NVS1B13_21570 [Flavisolibacter sp.]